MYLERWESSWEGFQILLKEIMKKFRAEDIFGAFSGIN